MKFKIAFTLAEIMIALVVIGVITSILLPVAFNSVPDENVMKFKKGNATLAKVINELVSSEKYYADGDLGKYPNGDLVDGSHNGDLSYFCASFSDILSLKSSKCSEFESSSLVTNSGNKGFVQMGEMRTGNFLMEDAKKNADEMCKLIQSAIGEEIKTTDNIIYFQAVPTLPFGVNWKTALMKNEEYASEDAVNAACNVYCEKRLFNSGIHIDNFGFDRIYKVFCMDIDGINQGEDPFGYGIRADGKILTGKRADEWLEKSIQDKE